MAITATLRSPANNRTANSSTFQATLTGTPSAGSTLVVGVWGWVQAGMNPAATCTDSAGNVYTKDLAQESAGDDVAIIFRSTNIPAGPTWVKVDFPGSSVTGSIIFPVVELTGMTSVSPVDKSGSATATSTSAAPGAVTTTNAPDYVCAVFSLHETSGSTDTLPASPWVLRQRETDGNTYEVGGVVDQVAAGTGTFNPSWIPGGGSCQWRALIAAYKGVSVPSGTVDQSSFRWRNDDGTEATATWLAAENADTTQPAGMNVRLRLLLDSSVSAVSATQFQLEYKKSTDATYTPVLAATPAGSLPTFVAKGTFTSGTAALTVPVPAGYQDDDLFLLFVESANQAIATPAGWTQAPSSPQFTGTAAAAGGVRLGVFYKVVAGTQSSVSVADPGDHATAIIMCFRGVDTTNPINASAGKVDATATAAVSCPAVTTTSSNCLVVNGIALDRDLASTTNLSAQANSSLSGLTKQHDQTVIAGVGGGLAVFTGGKAAAGSSGNTTATDAVSETHAFVTLALQPAPAATPPVLLGVSANIAAGGSTTTAARLTPPAAGTFQAGYLSDDTNPLAAISLPLDGYTEVEWCLVATATAADGDVYQFRVTRAGTALDTYTVIPAWTVGTPVISTTPVGTEVSTVWGARAAASAQGQVKWVTRATASQTRQAVWRVRVPAKTSQQTVWNVRTSAGAQRQTPWNARAATGPSRQARWNSRTNAFATRQSVWNVHTPAATQRQQAWNVRAAAGAQRQEVWNARAAAGSQRQTVWKARAFAARTSAAVWKARAAAGAQRQVVWSLRAAVGSPRQAAWNTRASASLARQVVWNDRVTAAFSRAELWKVRAAAGAQRQAVWNDRAVAAFSRAGVWNARTLTTSQWQARWNARVPAGQGRAHLWRVRAPAWVQRQAVWNTLSLAPRSAVGSQAAALWRVRQALGISRAESWNARAAAGLSRQTPWVVRAAVWGYRQAVWRALGVAVSQRQALWKARALVPLSRQSPWNARAPVESLRRTLWTIRTAVWGSRQSTWRSLAAAAAQRQALWKARAAVPILRQAVWNDRVTTWALRTCQWNDHVRAFASRLQLWKVRAPAGAARAARWNTLANVVYYQGGSQNFFRWNTRAATAALRLGLWNVRAGAGSARAARWTTRQLTPASVAAVWRARASLSTLITTPWDYHSLAGIQTLAPWLVRSPAGASATILWGVQGQAGAFVEFQAKVGQSLELALGAALLVAYDLGVTTEVRWTVPILEEPAG
jgi:hypothetical protein